MRQERISRTDRARQARRAKRHDCSNTSGILTPKGGPAPDLDEELLRRISELVGSTAIAVQPA